MDPDSFRDRFSVLPPGPERTDLLLEFAEEHMQSRSEDLAPLLQAASDWALEAGDLTRAALAARLLGWLSHDRADYPKALEHFEAARSWFQRSGDTGGLLKALNGIGSVHSGLGRFETALAVYREALALAETQGDRQQAVYIEANIGEALAGLRQYDEAEVHLAQALKAGVLSPLNEALVRNELSRVYLAVGRTAEAEEAIHRSMTLAREGGFLSALAASLGLLGVLEAGRNPAKAFDALVEARAVARQAGDRSAEARVLLDLARLRAAEEGPDRAADLWTLALTLAQAIGARVLESEAWKGLAASRKAQGQWQEALAALERHQELSDRIHNENVTRQLSIFQADQARREAALFQEQSRKLQLLADLGQKITSSLDLETIVRRVYEGIGGLMRAETFGLGLYHPEADKIEFKLFIERGQSIDPFEVGASQATFSGWCVRHRQAIRLDDAEAEYQKYFAEMPPRFGYSQNHSRSCLYMPLLAGDEVLGLISAQSFDPFVYDDRDLAILKTLAASIAVAVENARLFEQVKTLATLDALTGAATRRHLFERAEEEFQRHRRDRAALSLIMIDLDRFKTLNDSWGHAVGDRVLAEFGALCLAHKRPHDLFGRYGGEEFSLLLPGTGLEGAVRLAERLCAQVRALTCAAPDGTPVAVTASFGVTEFGPGDTEITRVFGRADEALYAAKAAGRNRVAFLEATLPAKA